MSKRNFLFVLLILGVAFWFLGPTPNRPTYETTKLEHAFSFSDAIAKVQLEQENPKWKPGNEPLLYLKDSSRTAYSILYLHGFSASPEEGSPTHTELADTFGFNLYAPTLCDHGLKGEDPLLNYTAECAWESAVEALEVALALGDSVIIVSTSTGGALAIRLASLSNRIVSLVSYSPNIMPVDAGASMLNNHWGETIARLVIGSRFRDVEKTEPYYEQYWNRFYRIESLPEMQELIESAFEEEYVHSIQIPIYIAAWYESDTTQDDVVSVEKMKWWAENTGGISEIEYFPAGTHVIANGVYSSSQQAILNSSVQFIESLGILPKPVDALDSLR